MLKSVVYKMATCVESSNTIHTH